MQFTPGTRFNQYEILSPLGKGGMGEVYLARDAKLERNVALKVLPLEFTFQFDRLRRFEQEAKAVSALNHPNIITIHEIGAASTYAGNTHFITTEFIAGQTLRDRLAKEKPSLTSALEIAMQTATALAAAHAANIIHRDIKPENIMLRTDGIVKVLDFGLAKLTEKREEVKERLGEDDPTLALSPQSATPRAETDPGTVMGTAHYMSPEQARGEKVDARSDIFSLGVVLYEMVAGQRPFDGVNIFEQVAAVLDREPTPLTDAPPELQRIVSKALRKDREQRYQHVNDLLLDVKDLKQELEIEAKLKSRQTVSNVAQTVNLRAAATDEINDKQTTSSASIILSELKRHRLGVAISVAAILVIAGGGSLWLYQLLANRPSSNNPPAALLTPRPFTTFSGREETPAFSPDGNQIAFSWGEEKNDNRDIYIKLIDAGTPLRLTTSPETDTNPTWSPDGRHIVFRRSFKNGSGIFMVPVLGGTERELLSSSGVGRFRNYSQLSFSPDGKQLAFAGRVKENEGSQIFLLSMDSLEKRPLTSPLAENLSDSSPAFSPDGKTIAFVRHSLSGSAGIFLVPSDGGDPKRLTPQANNIRGLCWSTDGREIIFASEYSGLWHVAVSGGTPSQLSVGVNNSDYPAISRQGNRLAWTETAPPQSDIWRFEVGSNKNNSATKFIASTLRDVSPQYSADGKKIAFCSDRSGVFQVWTCDSDGSNPFQVTAFDGKDRAHPGTPRWSPDGRQIVFDMALGNRDIYVVNASGGQLRKLTTEASDDVVPSWSRDGKWIYFGANRGDKSQVWKVPAEGGQAIQVTKQGGREAFESPDGKFLYYGKDRRLTSLWRVPVAGGEETQVLEQIYQGYWAVTEPGIYYVEPQSNAPYTVKFFNFATGEKTVVRTFEKEIAMTTPGLSISPDRRWLLLLLQPEVSESDIMLADNFR